MPKVKVALIGVGNCASAFIQGIQYYAKSPDCVGLRNPVLADLGPKDIAVVAAFDVDARKVGKDLSEAIWMKPNVCEKFADVPNLGVKISPGIILDGVAPHMREVFNVYDDGNTTKESILKILKDTKTQVLVNYLPVGSHADVARPDWWPQPGNR